MKYLVRDIDGNVHIGETIKSYLESNGISYTHMADKIGISRGGFYQIMAKPHITTDRLLQISEATNHNFFRYYVRELLEEDRRHMAVGEPEEPYERAPKRTKIILEMEDGKVIGQSTGESHLIDSLLERQEQQWQVLMTLVKETGMKMAKLPSAHPGNIPMRDEPMKGEAPKRKRQRGAKPKKDNDESA